MCRSRPLLPSFPPRHHAPPNNSPPTPTSSSNGKEAFFAEGPGEKNEDQYFFARLKMDGNGDGAKSLGFRAGRRTDVRSVGAKRERVSGPSLAGSAGRAARPDRPIVRPAEHRAGLYHADPGAVAATGGTDRAVSRFAGRAGFSGFDLSRADRGGGPLATE